MTNNIEVVIGSVKRETRNIKSWELIRPDGGELPPFTAGAHINLHLSNGIVRSYSLCNPQSDRNRYVVAINLDPQSRGGSRFIHETLKPGDHLNISAPRNNFPLVEDASHLVLVAGGIGITPLYSMIERLETLGRSWELHYGARTRETCAFEDRLVALETRKSGRVHFNFDHEPGGRPIDIKSLIARSSAQTHFYCCGPIPMLKAFETAARELHCLPDQVHVEYFGATEEAAKDGGFTVVLARSNKSLVVPAGKSILEVLTEHDIDVPCSCRDGICGTCETLVIDGVPDHRDSVLSPEDRALNRTIMVCCSGSKTDTLVLDL